MKKIFLLPLLFFFMLVQAQPPSRFVTSIGGDGDDVGYSAKVTKDRQYIVAGSTSSYGNHGNTDMYLVKVDTFGVPAWQKFIGGIGNDMGKAVIQLSDSGYVIAGFTSSFGFGGYDAYLVKTDKRGDLVWQTTYGGLDWDFANDVVLAPDGNIVMVGSTQSFGSGKKDGFVAKFDLSGNMIWHKTFGGAENDELRSIIVTNDNMLATVGYTESKGDVNGDGYFIKLNLNGDTVFTHTFGGPYKDFANDVVQKANGEYIIAGAKTFSTNPNSEAYMHSISATGQLVWYASFNDMPGDEAYVSATNSKQSSTLTAYVKPRSVSSLGLQADVFVASSYGNAILINASGDVGTEIPYSIEATPDKGYICVGSTNSYGSFGTNVYLIKLDSAISNYVSVVGINTLSKPEAPLMVRQDEQLYVTFGNREASTVQVYDISGRLMEEQTVKGNEAHVNLTTYPASVYLLRIHYKNDEVYTTKFIR